MSDNKEWSDEEIGKVMYDMYDQAVQNTPTFSEEMGKHIQAELKRCVEEAKAYYAQQEKDKTKESTSHTT